MKVTVILIIGIALEKGLLIVRLSPGLRHFIALAIFLSIVAYIVYQYFKKRL
jgi:hypothetical protein